MPLTFNLPLDFERKLFEQLDFALVRTYTKAAQVAQAAVRAKIPQHFVLRNNFVLNGIRTQSATKQDPTAYVFGRTEGPFSIAFMLLHETGGIKKPRNRNLAIPTGNVKRNKRDIVTKANRPRAQREKPTVFTITRSTPHRYRHDMQPGIYRRGHRGKEKRKVILLFAFQPRARIKAQFNFVDTAIKAAQAALPKLFEESLIEAIRTAR